MSDRAARIVELLEIVAPPTLPDPHRYYEVTAAYYWRMNGLVPVPGTDTKQKRAKQWDKEWATQEAKRRIERDLDTLCHSISRAFEGVGA